LLEDVQGALWTRAMLDASHSFVIHSQSKTFFGLRQMLGSEGRLNWRPLSFIGHRKAAGSGRRVFACDKRNFCEIRRLCWQQRRNRETGSRVRRPHGVMPGRLFYALDCSALRRDIVRIVRTIHDG
jgi:hypothetical protein